MVAVPVADRPLAGQLQELWILACEINVLALGEDVVLAGDDLDDFDDIFSQQLHGERNDPRLGRIEQVARVLLTNKAVIVPSKNAGKNQPLRIAELGGSPAVRLSAVHPRRNPEHLSVKEDLADRSFARSHASPILSKHALDFGDLR